MATVSKTAGARAAVRHRPRSKAWAVKGYRERMAGSDFSTPVAVAYCEDTTRISSADGLDNQANMRIATLRLEMSQRVLRDNFAFILVRCYDRMFYALSASFFQDRF